MRRYFVIWKFCIAALAAWVFPASVHATPTIDTATYNLDFNTKTTIQINAHDPSGTELVQGLDLSVQTGNGGIFVSGGTLAGTAPMITAVNAQPGSSIFTTANSNPQSFDVPVNNSGIPNPNPAQSQVWQDNFETSAAFPNGVPISADQLLATITIDTTGFLIGQTFPMYFIATEVGSTDFDLLPAGGPNPVSPSTLVIVPEPSSLALLFLGVPLLIMRRRAAVASS